VVANNTTNHNHNQEGAKSMEDLPVDQLVRVYRKIRDVVQEKEDAHKAEIAELKAKMDMVSTKLLDICNAQNLR